MTGEGRETGREGSPPASGNVTPPDGSPRFSGVFRHLSSGNARGWRTAGITAAVWAVMAVPPGMVIAGMLDGNRTITIIGGVLIFAVLFGGWALESLLTRRTSKPEAAEPSPNRS